MYIAIKNVSTPEDIALTAQLGQEIWHEHYDSLIGPDQVDYILEHFQSVPAITEQIAHGTTYLLAYWDDEPAGYCAFKPEEHKMFLSKIYVRRTYRKLGIASVMFDQVQKRHWERVVSTSLSTNTTAVLLWLTKSWGSQLRMKRSPI